MARPSPKVTRGSYLLTHYHLRKVSRKKRIGNVRSKSRKVYFLLRSERLSLSSQIGPQNSFSKEIGVEHTTQCLCLGIVVRSSFLKYFDMEADNNPLRCNINYVGLARPRLVNGNDSPNRGFRVSFARISLVPRPTPRVAVPKTYVLDNHPSRMSCCNTGISPASRRPFRTSSILPTVGLVHIEVVPRLKVRSSEITVHEEALAF